MSTIFKPILYSVEGDLIGGMSCDNLKDNRFFPRDYTNDCEECRIILNYIRNNPTKIIWGDEYVHSNEYKKINRYKKFQLKDPDRNPLPTRLYVLNMTKKVYYAMDEFKPGNTCPLAIFTISGDYYVDIEKYDWAYDVFEIADKVPEGYRQITRKEMENDGIYKPEINYYVGDIQPTDDIIFVFGSNPEGRHGAGAAKVAVEKFGAIYGQGEGPQGHAYAIPTKDLRVKENNGYRSISERDIRQSIEKMYEYAEKHPDKKFCIAYRNTGRKKTLNGYTGDEMMYMFRFAYYYIPRNIYISEEWYKSGNFDH